VPALTKLHCNNNQLSELIFSHVDERTLFVSGGTLFPIAQELAELDCSSNRLTELVVSLQFRLITVRCFKNRLTELTLWGVPRLSELDCSDNHLTELDLSKLDVRGRKQLTKLSCDPSDKIQHDATQDFENE
jgi:Leucine-rich repeat (LRR) protein